MIRLANTETSLEAVEKTIAASSRNQSVKIGDAKRAVRENEKMDRKGGGPVHWSVFYGRTADKFFYHPTDRNSTYHTVTVLSQQPPQNDNKTAGGVPSRQGLPVHNRPPQFDYIYRANQEAKERAEADADKLKNKIEALLDRRQKLELEQNGLWVEIAFHAIAISTSIRNRVSVLSPLSPPTIQIQSCTGTSSSQQPFSRESRCPSLTKLKKTKHRHSAESNRPSQMPVKR